MRPTANFIMFQMAEEMHCTVAKLVTGHDMPMGNIEYKLVLRYKAAKARLEQQQRAGRGKSGRRR